MNSRLEGKTQKPNPMSKVNLDALIPRADFAVISEVQKRQTNIPYINLQHLLPPKDSYTSLYHLLKKPDFQRETNEWNKNRIADLIQSFIDGAFIPSIILWENEQTGNIYIIDGAHRLSAIIAYINDDYGDNKISQEYYGLNKIPKDEIILAEDTRNYVNNKIGAFVDIMVEGNPNGDNFRKGSFDIQIIKGNVGKAEDSFFKINQQGVALSPTEKALCRSRQYPSCIATRSIIKGGAGTQYWKNFEPQNQNIIKSIAEDLNQRLFLPSHDEKSQTVVNHNLGGQVTIATPMIFNLMKMIRATYLNNKEEKDIVKGESTVQYLELTRKLVWLIFSQQSGSLGLYPSIYFRTNTGAYIQSAFLGICELLIDNRQHETPFLLKFTTVRSKLENFLVKYRVFLNQINKHFGSKEKSSSHMKGYFLNLINLFHIGLSENEVLIKMKEKYDFLNELETDYEKPTSRKFNDDTRIYVSNKEELEATRRCKICNGFLHTGSQSPDHKLDLKHGGGSEPSNLNFCHHYCNNSKDKLITMGFYKP